MTFVTTATFAAMMKLAAILAFSTAAYEILSMPTLSEKTRPMVGLAILIYVLPSLIAFGRRHPSRWIISLVNVICGATIIGWVVAIVWAFSATKPNIVITQRMPAPDAPLDTHKAAEIAVETCANAPPLHK